MSFSHKVKLVAVVCIYMHAFYGSACLSNDTKSNQPNQDSLLQLQRGKEFNKSSGLEEQHQLPVSNVKVNVQSQLESDPNAKVLFSNNDQKPFSFDVPPFDPQVAELPINQLQFLRDVIKRDFRMYRNIVKEAIEMRRSFGASIKLTLKYSPKILGSFIINRRAEKKLVPRVDEKSDFWTMQADMAERVMEKSEQFKKSKLYTKDNVDIDEFSRRANDIFDYMENIIEHSPLGNYLRWDKLVLFKNQLDRPRHDLNFIHEIADLLAQFQALGYDGSVKVTRKIVNLLRKFAKGAEPNELEAQN